MEGDVGEEWENAAVQGTETESTFSELVNVTGLVVRKQDGGRVVLFAIQGAARMGRCSSAPAALGRSRPFSECQFLPLTKFERGDF